MKTKKIIRFAFCVAFAISLFAGVANSQTWQKVDNDSLYPAIHKIFFPSYDSNAVVIASGDVPINLAEKEITFYDQYPQINGKGYVISYDGGLSFDENKLDGYFVYEIAEHPFNPDIWLASVRSSGKNFILVSEDGGETWITNPVRYEGSEAILKITSKASEPTRFFAAEVNVSKGFKTSLDTFRHFETNQDLFVSSRDIAVSPSDTNLIFIASDDLHESGVFRSYDNGETWTKEESGLENLRVHCVLPSQYDPSIVVCGADSLTSSGSVGKGIYVSLDTGKTWTLTGAEGARVFNLARHPKNPIYMAAACDSSGVWLSGTWGTSWEQFDDGFDDSLSIRTVAFPRLSADDDGAIVFAGSYKGGLYKSERITTSVESRSDVDEESVIIQSLSPNPCSENLTVVWNNPKTQKVRIEIVNLKGERIAEIINEEVGEGLQTTKQSLIESDLSSGSYFLVIFSGAEAVTKQFVFIKR